MPLKVIKFQIDYLKELILLDQEPTFSRTHIECVCMWLFIYFKSN